MLRFLSHSTSQPPQTPSLSQQSESKKPASTEDKPGTSVTVMNGQDYPFNGTMGESTNGYNQHMPSLPIFMKSNIHVTDHHGKCEVKLTRSTTLVDGQEIRLPGTLYSKQPYAFYKLPIFHAKFVPKTLNQYFVENFAKVLKSLKEEDQHCQTAKQSWSYLLWRKPIQWRFFCVTGLSHLFRTFGTHFVSEADFGGTIELDFYLEKTTRNTVMDALNMLQYMIDGKIDDFNNLTKETNSEINAHIRSHKKNLYSIQLSHAVKTGNLDDFTTWLPIFIKDATDAPKIISPTATLRPITDIFDMAWNDLNAQTKTSLGDKQRLEQLFKSAVKNYSTYGDNSALWQPISNERRTEPEQTSSNPKLSAY